MNYFILISIFSNLSYNKLCEISSLECNTKNKIVQEILLKILTERRNLHKYTITQISAINTEGNEKLNFSIHCVLTIENSEFIATGGTFSTINFFDKRYLKLAFYMENTWGTINSMIHLKGFQILLEEKKDDIFIAITTEKSSLVIINVSQKKVKYEFDLITSAIALAYYPSSLYIVTTTNKFDKGLRKFTINGKNIGKINYLHGHLKSANSIEFINKDFLVSASYDYTIKIWDLTSNQVVGNAKTANEAYSIKVFKEKTILSGHKNYVILWGVEFNQDLNLKSLVYLKKMFFLKIEPTFVWGVGYLINNINSTYYDYFFSVGSSGALNILKMKGQKEFEFSYSINFSGDKNINLNHCDYFYDLKTQSNVIYVAGSDGLLRKLELN